MQHPNPAASEHQIQQRIYIIRSRRVILDTDLASLYGTATKRLNEQAKRNRKRFPEDFMFRLTGKEFEELVAICDRSSDFRHLSSPPFAFTEHGVIMAANVLNSLRAVEMSVVIVRAFVRMRELLETQKELLKKIDALESKYDQQFRVVFDAIRQLMTPSSPPRRRIGF